MAEKRIEIELMWEDGVKFEMTSTLVDAPNGSPPISILEIHENADMESVWSYCADLCISYIRSRLDDIGTEMTS